MGTKKRFKTFKKLQNTQFHRKKGNDGRTDKRIKILRHKSSYGKKKKINL
jgi:hypothetical protein